MKKLNISLVQHSIKEGKIEENLKTVRNIVTDFSSKDLDLLVFPELFLTGYPYSRFKESASEIRKSPEMDFLTKLAEKSGVWITGGSFIEKQNDSYFNTMPLIDPKGKIVDTYRKIHLFSPMEEDKYFTPGNLLKTVKTDFGTIGLSLCYDIRFPEMFRLMSMQGAEIIIVAAEFPEPRLDHWLTLLKARAIENQLYIVAVNRCKGNRLYNFLGNSVIIDPWGEILVNAEKEEGIFSHEIDLSFVHEVRSRIPSFQDTKREFFNLTPKL